MSDDEVRSAAPSVIPVALGALASVVDPTGVAGVAVALMAHYVTEATSDAAWRRANLAHGHEALIDGDTEKGKARAKQPFQSENEFEQHRIILDWLKEDLAEVIGRVENLEIVALGIMQRSEALLRKRSDPEMRPYLLNVWRNSVRRPGYFNGTWMSRCLALLEKLGADHLALLCRLAPHIRGSRAVMADQGMFHDMVSATPDSSLAWDELCEMKVTSRPPVGERGYSIPLGPYTARLVELVSRPSQAVGADAQQ